MEKSSWYWSPKTVPRDRFQPRWVGFPSRKGTLQRIGHLMRVGIAGPFHHHKMGRIVLKQEMAIFQDIRFSPPCKVKPCLWIKGIAIPRIAVFINPRGESPILIGSYSRKSGNRPFDIDHRLQQTLPVPDPCWLAHRPQCQSSPRSVSDVYQLRF